MNNEIEIIESKTVNEYYIEIKSSWTKSVQEIIKTAQGLLEAEQKLSTSDFRSLKKQLTDERIFSTSGISKLMGIAKNKVLTNPEYTELLPPSYATLYELKDIKEDDLIQSIKEQKLTPSVQRNQLESLFPSYYTKDKKPNTEKLKDTSIETLELTMSWNNLEKELQNDIINLLEKLDDLEIVNIKIKGDNLTHEFSKIRD